MSPRLLAVWLPLIFVGSLGAIPLFGMDAPADARPNILFLLTDDQRPDTIHALGNGVIRTPHLDALAARGVAFSRAVCGNPICTPSRAEILTGASGFENGVLDFGGQIDPRLATWAGTLRRAGYHTWYVGKWHNNGRPSQHGFEESLGLFAAGGGKWETDRTDFKGSPITGYRGWAFQNMEGSQLDRERGVGLRGDISRDFADAAIELLRRKTDRPWLLQVNFTAPHDPLLEPPAGDFRLAPEQVPLPQNFLPRHPFDHGNLLGRDERLLPAPHTPRQVQQVLAMYYRVIHYTDQQIGRILAALGETGQAGRTIVIFSSDHGLAVGSHGLRGKQNMYDHTIGVPLVIAGPGIPAGEQRSAQVYLRDLFPTTCELAGVPVPKTVTGRSLAGVLTGREKAVYPHVFGYFRNFQRMIRTERWKLIHYPQLDRYQLFDLQSDPQELRDLASLAEHRFQRDELAGKLRAWQASVQDPVLKP